MRVLASLCLSLLPVSLWAEPETVTPTARAVGGVGATQMLQVGLSLLLILVLIGAMAWLLRRFGSGVQALGGAGPMRVLASLSIGARERLLLVQIGEEQLLLGVSPAGIRTLHTLAEPLELAPGEGGSFAERLAAALNRKGES